MKNKDSCYCVKKENEITIGNSFLERRFRVVNGRLRSVALLNKLTGRLHDVVSNEFLVELAGSKQALDARAFTVENIKTKVGASFACVTFKLSADSFPVKIDLVCELKSNSFYMRKRLVIETDRLIKRVAVECLKFKGRTSFEMGGFGQPLFINNEIFTGLEYPAGYNTSKAKVVELFHFPGRSGKITSKTAVTGVAADIENERARDAFFKYLNENRARTVKYMSQLGEIAWRYPGRRALEAMSCKEVFEKAKEVFIDRGVKLDGVYLHGDRQWANPKSIMGELPEKDQKPFTLKQRVEWAEKLLGAKIVMHLNTGGGRGSGDHAWFRENFDMINSRYYCLADKRAIGQLTDNLSGVLKKYDFAGFSFDWLWWVRTWECGQKGHSGHIPGRKYGREAITDRFIEMCQALRKIKPDIILEDLEVELSPWWLFYADALWSYAGEGDKIPFEEIDGAVTRWTKKHVVFPLSSIWYATPEPEVSFGRNYPEEHMLHYVLIHYLRGGQMEEFYFNFPEVKKTTMDKIASIIRWARAREDILLANSHPILGDPFKREVYGYAHFKKDNRGIIGVRNPAAWRECRVRVKLDETCGFMKSGQPVSVEVVYPYRAALPGTFSYGDFIEYSVPGDEIVVFETFPSKRAAKTLLPFVEKPERCVKPEFRLSRKKGLIAGSLKCETRDDEVWELVVSLEVLMKQKSSLAEQMQITNKRLALMDAPANVQHGGIEIEAVTNAFAENAGRFLELAKQEFSAEFKMNGRLVEFKKEVFTIGSRIAAENGVVQATENEACQMVIRKVGPHPNHTNILLYPLRFRLELHGQQHVEFSIKSAGRLFSEIMSDAFVSAHINRMKRAGGEEIQDFSSGLPVMLRAETRTTVTLSNPARVY